MIAPSAYLPITSDEVHGRIEKFGPNAVPDTGSASIAQGR